MKLKKNKKVIEALVTVLEFVRVSASTEPTATTNVLKRAGWHSEVFAKRVNKLVKIAVDNANAQGLSIDDILTGLRKKSRKMVADDVFESTNSAADDDEENDDDEEEDGEEAEEDEE